MPDGPRFSILIFACLLTALIASGAMFWLLVRRATSRRHDARLLEWARGAGFRVRHISVDAALPAPFSHLELIQPLRVRKTLTDGKQSLIELGADDNGKVGPLNVLIRPLSNSWPATALLPTGKVDRNPGVGAEPGAAIALFSLPKHLLMSTDRFIAAGADSAVARRLTRSRVRALLPGDLGLLLYENYFVLDFSSRFFDTLEFARLITLADQIIAYLPKQK